ncbi:MAG: DEAD/DEAH box helicase [Salaquimonas sp.]
MTDFHGVVPALAKALAARGYETLTPVQKAVLAPELDGADALVSAQTGSGKTVAFGIALAPGLLEGKERFGRADKPLALAIAPTRELAMQVKKELEWLYADTGAKIASCVGGMDIRSERRALSDGAHIVVGTPGRLCDHIKRNALRLDDIKAVVLDEADEMLDLGFKEELEFILSAAPETRRTLMFSATVPRSIASLAKRYQRDAVRVETKSEEKQHMDIEYRALVVSGSDRENAIINVLRYYEAKNALVFCATRAMVNHMTARFSNRGFSVVALSGELSQNERTHALQAMRDGRARVCIATDVAARGIDLPGLELVVHAELPKTSETLLHRSGRTGRAGNKGVCAIIVPHSQRRKAERLLGNANITAEWAKPPTADEVLARDDERLMADPALHDVIEPHEQEFIGKLVGKFTPEQMAAAILRLYRKDHSAPEDISSYTPAYEERSEGRGPKRRGPREDNDRPQRGERGERSERPDRGERAPRPAKSKDRNDFVGGVWFSLSVGRKHKAEPKWLIPMLCRAGDFNKPQIGAIRIQDNETHVEIDPAHVDKFVTALGKNGMLEKSISVTQLAGEPARDSNPLPAEDYQKKRESYREKSGFSKPQGRSEPRAEEKPENTIEARPSRKPKQEQRSSIDDILGDFDEPAFDDNSQDDGFIGNRPRKEFRKDIPANDSAEKPDQPKRKSGGKSKPHKGKDKSKGKPGWAKPGGKKKPKPGARIGDGSQALKRPASKRKKSKD